MSARNEDFLFAQEAQNKGYVSETQVEEAFRLQKRMAEELKIDERLAVILVKRGWMAEEQARRIYSLLEPEGRRTRIEGYRLVEKIGRGAMGTVYKAIHLGLHRVVAIKVLRRELVGDKIHSERLKREAQMLADLDHPNIVRAMDAGESNGFPYVVMEYVEGETLKERITRDGPFDEDTALRLARDLADALERARRMGVVHRDIKPGNVLLSKRGVAKLMDLGLAKGPVDLELTQHGATVGTPQFMSPEQAQEAGRADTRSDIYSLGATLYMMLTGRPPHSGSTMAEIITKVLYRQPVPIRARNEDVSPEVSYLVERMMLKDPELRYQTPVEVCDDIDRITGGRSIVPRGFTGNWEAWLLRQRMKKRQRLLTIAAGVLVLLGVGTFLFVRSVQRDAARERIALLEARVLEIQPPPPPAPDRPPEEEDAREAEERRRIESARRLAEQIRRVSSESGVPATNMTDVEEHIRGLEEFRTRLANLRTVEIEALAIVANGRFARAHRTAQNYQPGNLTELAARRQALISEIETASRQAWSDLLGAGKAAKPVTLEDWVSNLRQVATDLGAERFVEEDPLREQRTTVQRLARKAQEIWAKVVGFEKAFSDERFGEALRRDAFAGARRDVREAGAKVEQAHRMWTGASWYAEGARFELAPRIVERVQRRVERLEELVRAAWIRLVARTEEMRVPAQINQALKLLRVFENQLVLGEYPDDMQSAAVKYIKELDELALEIDAARDSVLFATARRVLSAVFEGDGEGVRSAVQKGVEETLAGDGQRARVRSLEAGADAVTSIRVAALQFLQSNAQVRRSLDSVLMKDGARRNNWRLDRVTAEGRLVSRWEGQRRETELALDDFHLAQRLEWAKDAKPRPPALHIAITELALLPNEQFAAVRDLLTVQAGLDLVLEGLRSKHATSSWFEVATHWAQHVKREQDDRETDSVKEFNRIEKYHNSGFYPQVVKLARIYLDPEGRTWFTQTRIKHEARVRKLLAYALSEIERNEMQQWLLGVRVRPLDGLRAELTYDFNVQEVGERFLFGYFQFVDEPRASGVAPVITPPERTEDSVREQRLRLLPEVNGLKRGWPLGLENIFESTKEIAVEFDLFTLASGCFLLGVDIDGVQLVVWSADPNWYRDEWALPEALRTDPTDDLIWYGRGRGVATHTGPGFGNIPGTGWEFHDYQSGKHYRRWSQKQRELETGDRFAFRPGRNYRVRVVRKGDEIRLLQAPLDDWKSDPGALVEVFRQKEPRWAKVGKNSDLAPMSRGSGRIQLLTWNTVEIDNLVLTGDVRASWRAAQKDK